MFFLLCNDSRDDPCPFVLLYFPRRNVLPDLIYEFALLLHVVLVVALILADFKFHGWCVELLRVIQELLLRFIQVLLLLLVREWLVHYLLQLRYLYWCWRFVCVFLFDWLFAQGSRRHLEKRLLLFFNRCSCDWGDSLSGLFCSFRWMVMILTGKREKVVVILIK